MNHRLTSWLAYAVIHFSRWALHTQFPIDSIRETYAKESRATNKNALSDVYVKFFRWAADRLKARDGIVCFVSNNSFVDQIAFDGMRKHLLQDFNRIYVVDLKGNIRKDSMRDGIPLGEAHTVFGLGAMVGISITILIRNKQHEDRQVFYHSVDFRSTRREKFELLEKVKSISGISWRSITPDKSHTWLVPENATDFGAFLPLGSRDAKLARNTDSNTLFKTYGRGVATSRDDVVYDFNADVLRKRVSDFADAYNTEVDRYRRAGGIKVVGKGRDKTDAFVHYSNVKWSFTLKSALERGIYAAFENSKVRNSLYRPFCHRYLFFDKVLNESVYQFPHFFPVEAIEGQNQILAVTDVGSEKPFMLLIANSIADLHLVGAGASCQCFPFFAYDEDGSNRRENITDWALAQFRDHYADQSISKWDIFYYVYGVLHHPGYREKFADNLKRELPRIPFAPGFRAFAEAGRQLADLHLNYETVTPYKLQWKEAKDIPLSYRVEKMRLNKDKTALQVNESLTLAGIPPEAFQYRLGNRSALEWVIDQYQVTTDKRSGITSNPNRADDERYIVDLVGRVITVSIETTKIVAGLPEQYSDK